LFKVLTISRQKSGMSATTRPHTKLPSLKAASSTQVAPALTKSSLMPRDPVAFLPFKISAETASDPP
jgi:hypothetical protein